MTAPPAKRLVAQKAPLVPSKPKVRLDTLLAMNPP